MALDGAFLSVLCRELQAVVGSRIDRIHQPSREEIMMTLRFKGGSEKLLISVGADSPRIHFTRVALENPKTPPMFCMLLRKHLGSGKLIAVRQFQMDRILSLDFETINELGDLVVVTLVVEIMGRHSNLIVVGQDGRIIDALKRVDPEMSGVRPVLPGMKYMLPPLQDKINLQDCSNETILKAIESFAKNDYLSKILVQVLQGVSPILAREMVHYTCRGQDIPKSEISDEQKARLSFYLDMVRKAIKETPCITMVLTPEGIPKDYSFVAIHQYGASMLTKQFDTASELLDQFYAQRDQLFRMKQRSNDLLKLLVNTSERIERKLALQSQELEQCGEREQLKVYGDLLNSNLYQIEKSQSSITVQNYYDENGGSVTIPLDPSLAPAKNAQKYYIEYRKAATAEKMLTELMIQAKEELAYIESVFDAVTRTTGESELLEIRDELAESGYLKNYKNRNKQLKPKPPLKYCSKDGFTILCGRNNKQNDRLTLKEARNYDIWLHTHNIPGSHVIIVTHGKEVPNSTLEQAAQIAAYNSKARESTQVPVDYTQVRNVKKPNGARPGMVIFDHYQTAYITPDRSLVEALQVK